MTPPEPKACTACASHVRFGNRHLCTLPIEAFGGLLQSQHHHDEPLGDNSDREYIGTSCDQVRRMGEICGPAGALWEPAKA